MLNFDVRIVHLICSTADAPRLQYRRSIFAVRLRISLSLMLLLFWFLRS